MASPENDSDRRSFCNHHARDSSHPLRKYIVAMGFEVFVGTIDDHQEGYYYCAGTVTRRGFHQLEPSL
jgi:hypothetical protein